jgi:hypothetical protein
MKYVLVVLLFITGSLEVPAQQGRYAGSLKSLVGVTYTDSRQIPALASWTMRQGSVASLLSDPEWFMVEIFQKGTTYAILFSLRADTSTETQVIQDVVEVKNVSSTWEVKSALCREYETENAFIVAVIKPDDKEYTKAKKAWRFNRDKRRFEPVSAKIIDCLNEGFDKQE